ncbi:hypothetical protein [Streptomyces olivochromogenes]
MEPTDQQRAGSSGALAVRMEARHAPLLVWALLAPTDTEVTR